MDVAKIYGIGYVPDRRKVSMAVDVDRRSGVDRRKSPRLTLDPKIKQDFINTKNILTPSPVVDVFQKAEANEQKSLSAVSIKSIIKPKKVSLGNYLQTVSWRSTIPMTIDILKVMDNKDKRQTAVSSVCRGSGATIAAASTYGLLSSVVNPNPLVVIGVAAAIGGAIAGNHVAKQINSSLNQSQNTKVQISLLKH